jgi:hypothetical protein
VYIVAGDNFAASARDEPDGQLTDESSSFFINCVGWVAERSLDLTRIGAEVTMAKLHSRPSLQYRYEHYDPRW